MRKYQVLIVIHVDIARIEEEDWVDPFEYFCSIGVICYGGGDEGRDECQWLSDEIEGCDSRIVDRVELYMVAEVVYLITQGRWFSNSVKLYHLAYYLKIAGGLHKGSQGLWGWIEENSERSGRIEMVGVGM